MCYIATPRLAKDQPFFILTRSCSNVIEEALRRLVDFLPPTHACCAQLGVFHVGWFLWACSCTLFGHCLVHGTVLFVGLSICHGCSQCRGSLGGIHLVGDR